MANQFYFYTDPTQIEPQNSKASFGKRDPNILTDPNQYRLVSRHRATSSGIYPRAIAAASGRICVVEVENEDYVTIILQPDFQTTSAIPNVKYFIYRGILKSSLYNTTTDQILNGTNGDSGFFNNYENDLTLRIKATYAAQLVAFPLALLPPPPIPTKKILGTNRPAMLKETNDYFHLNYNEIPIDALFYYSFDDVTLSNLNEVSFAFYRVEAGWEIGRFRNKVIGNFDSDYFGFQIMFDNAGFNPTLDSVIDNGGDTINQVIDLPSNNTFDIKSQQLEILNYLDPAAFYGSLAVDDSNQIKNGEFGLKVVNTSSNINQSSAHSFYEYKTNDEIYNNLLVGPSSSGFDDLSQTNGIFYNRNTVYLDIRDRYGNCYNYFEALTLGGNIDLELSFGTSDPTSSGTSAEIKAYSQGQNANWPLMALDNAITGNIRVAFPVAKEFKEKDPSNPSNDLTGIPIPISEAMVYFDNENIISKDGLEDPIREGIDNFPFVRLKKRSNPINSLFGKGFTMHNQITSLGKPISNYIKLRYIMTRTVQGNNIAIPGAITGTDFPKAMEYETHNYLDFVFPINMEVLWKNTGHPKTVGMGFNIASTVYYDGVFVDNTAVSGNCFMANIGIAKDSGPDGPITIFAYNPKTNPHFTNISERGIIDRTFSITPLITSKKDAETTFLKTLSEKYEDLNYISVTLKPTSNSNNDKKVEYIYNNEFARENSDAGLSANINIANINDFIAITIPRSIYNALIQKYKTSFYNSPTYNKGSKVFLGFELLSSGRDNSRDKQSYIKYKYVLFGYKNGELEKFEPTLSSPNVNEDYLLLDPFDLLKYQLKISEEKKGFSITGTPPLREIECTVYMMRSPKISYTEFLNYQEYFINNIRHVWNTAKNPGLVRQKRPDPVNSPSILGGQKDINDNPLNINSNKVIIREWSPDKLHLLENNEIIILIDKDDGRSAILSTQYFIKDKKIERANKFRQGKLLFSSSKPITNQGNTAAHEFGHVLGLTDRYTYVAEVDNNNVIDKSPSSGKNVILYYPSNYDSDYGEDFMWWHNLMAISDNVPKINHSGSLFSTASCKIPSPSPAKYLEFMHPFSSSTNSVDGSCNTNNDNGTVFITPFQWNMIEGPYNENIWFITNFNSGVFFIDQGQTFPYGSFIGFDTINDPQHGDGFNLGMMTDFSLPSSNTETSMTNRRVTTPPDCIGYFLPYYRFGFSIDGVTQDDYLSQTNADTASFLVNLLTGTDSITEYNTELSKAKEDEVNSIVISTLGTKYNDKGESNDEPNGRGRLIWNKIEVPAIPVMHTRNGTYVNNLNETVYVDFKFTNAYLNRKAIIVLIRDGNLEKYNE